MDYRTAVEHLRALAGELHAPAPGQPRRKFRLEEMRMLVAALGNPERRFHAVLIAGTNGKGSTAATLESIVRAAGYRPGLYTSPHLERVNERVRIEGAEISDEAFARNFARVEEAAQRLVREGALPGPPSYFETMTALGFVAFAEAGVELAVLEVGMGGRLDATNIVEPLISVITDISLDHMEWLGDTVGAIAREKAGILRRGGTLVTLPQHPEANQAIGEAAVALDVRGVNAAEYLPGPGPGMASGGGPYTVPLLGEQVEIAPPLAGQHQQRNVALAIAAAIEIRNHHGYKLTAQQIARGVRETRWPGRLEQHRWKGGPMVLLDVAHNPAGAWALRAAISAGEREQEHPVKTLVFGCLRDKAIGEMAQILFPLFDRVVLTPVASPRSATLAELEEAAGRTGVQAVSAPDASTAFAIARNTTPGDGLIVVAGSVYLVGEVRGGLLRDTGPSDRPTP